MAHQSEGTAQTANEHYREQNTLSHPKISQRKSSFSEAFTKFTSNTFNRRRTDAGIPSSISSICIDHPSRIPTPAGIDRSTSFFSSLNTFASKSTPSIIEEIPQPSNTKRYRRISERLAQTPFFSHQHQQQPTSTPKENRKPSVKIEQRGLMQPVHPPLPRSNTIGSPGQSQQSSPHTPGFMRPTTSSARRSSLISRSNTAAPSSMAGHNNVAFQRQRNTPLRTIATPNPSSKTPTQARQVQAGAFPARSDSLVVGPTRLKKPATASESDGDAKQPDMLADYSDGANFQVIDQHSKELFQTTESTSGQPKISVEQVHPTRQAPMPKEAKKGILKSKGKNHKLSEALSNLYVDDEEEADSGKGELDNNNEVKSRSDQGSPDYSERTATPDSSNPRLVSIFPTHSKILSPRIHPLLMKNPPIPLPANTIAAIARSTKPNPQSGGWAATPRSRTASAPAPSPPHRPTRPFQPPPPPPAPTRTTPCTTRTGAAAASTSTCARCARRTRRAPAWTSSKGSWRRGRRRWRDRRGRRSGRSKGGLRG